MDLMTVYVLSGVMMLLLFIAIILTLIGKKYDYMLDYMENNAFRDLCLIGVGALQLIHYKFQSVYDRRMLKNCEIIYEKDAGYYVIALVAKQITAAFACVWATIGAVLLTNEPLVALVGAAVTITTVYYISTNITDEIKRRKLSVSLEFSEVLSKLALLVNAGSIMREAWEKVAFGSEGVIYDAMRESVANMRNGMNEADAYMTFAGRCNDPRVTKFASTIAQNMAKGNKELVLFLRSYADECWEERKQSAKRRGEEASGKLLIPIVIIFIGLIVMILVPMITGITI